MFPMTQVPEIMTSPACGTGVTGFAWPKKDPPLVQQKALGARQRLRGPDVDLLPENHVSLLSPTATTVNENGTVRFGDQLLLLNHATEVVLQADVSRTVKMIDESHSQRKEFDAVLVTTGKVLQPCSRNCFTVVRANRSDGFGDSLNVHFGQEIRILASTFISDQILYLHLHQQEQIALLPRAGAFTLWKVIEAPPPEQPPEGVVRPRDPAPLPGQAVRVNDRIALQNVQTGRLLMSHLRLVSTGFGIECDTFAEAIGSRHEVRRAELGEGLSTVEGDGRLCGIWSFVNDAWVDLVDKTASENVQVGCKWKEDESDDFERGILEHNQDEKTEAFNPIED